MGGLLYLLRRLPLRDAAKGVFVNPLEVQQCVHVFCFILLLHVIVDIVEPS